MIQWIDSNHPKLDLRNSSDFVVVVCDPRMMREQRRNGCDFESSNSKMSMQDAVMNLTSIDDNDGNVVGTETMHAHE
jgi:hypothetical protein